MKENNFSLKKRAKAVALALIFLALALFFASIARAGTFYETTTGYVRLFNTTDTQYAAYKQMKNASVGANYVDYTYISPNSTAQVFCWTPKWIAPNSTTRMWYNGTWNFRIYGYTNTNAFHGFMFAKILKYNGTEYLAYKTPQSTTDISTFQVSSIGVSAWTATVPYNTYTDIAAGQRIGVQICLNATGPQKNKEAHVDIEGIYPSNITLSSLTSVIKDNPPNVTLVSPANGYTSTLNYINFTCNVTDDKSLKNFTFYWNYSGTWKSNGTVSISGTKSKTGFYRTALANKAIKWNCLAFDTRSQRDWGDANRTVIVNTGASTCTPPGSGNWNIVCGDNCIWTTKLSVPANISITGTGTLRLNTTMNFTSSRQYMFIYSGCQIWIGKNGEII